jgi:hypothetical protein
MAEHQVLGPSIDLGASKGSSQPRPAELEPLLLLGQVTECHATGELPARLVDDAEDGAGAGSRVLHCVIHEHTQRIVGVDPEHEILPNFRIESDGA